MAVGRWRNRGASGARVPQAMTEETSIFGVSDVVWPVHCASVSRMWKDASGGYTMA